MNTRRAYRLSAALLTLALVLTIAIGAYHADPKTDSANNHIAAFTAYAGSDIWTAVHLGQFVAMAFACAGLLALLSGLQSYGGQSWTTRTGQLASYVALSLYGVLQAVDGVALKQAVNAWAAAPEAEKAARFASAEALRWLEWGLRSYQSLVFGFALVVCALAILRTGAVYRLIGPIMAVTGLAYLAQGWVIGLEGFAPSNTVPTLAGYISWLIWSPLLVLGALRMKSGETS